MSINSISNSIIKNEDVRSTIGKAVSDGRVNADESQQLKDIINNSKLPKAEKQTLNNFIDKLSSSTTGIKESQFLFFKSSEEVTKKISPTDLQALEKLANKNPIAKTILNAVKAAQREVATQDTNNIATKPTRANPNLGFIDQSAPADNTRVAKPSISVGQADQSTSTGRAFNRNDVRSFSLTQFTGSPSEKGDCGPTSGAMILRAFGIDASVQDVRNNSTGRKVTKNGGSGGAWALTEKQIGDSIKKISGGKVSMAGGTTTYGPKDQAKLLDDIRKSLAKGELPMMCTGVPDPKATYRHYTVITGIDEKGNIQMADPAYALDGAPAASVSVEELLQRMQNAKNLGRITTLTPFKQN
ncbi:MAG: C39 family peptidase [Candidatus Sericytochromatia bacterium]